MRQKSALLIVVAIILALSGSAAVAANDSQSNPDTENRMVNARVVEVADGHISIVTRSGIEHVIAIDRAGTKVTAEGRDVSLKDLSEGDIVTVELDAYKPVKFAKNISLSENRTEIARVRR